MSQDEQRNDATLRHFSSRSQQPKVLAAGPSTGSNGLAPPPVNVFVVFDQGFGTVSDQIDDNRFKHIGTNPQLSYYNKTNGRRLNHEVMKEGFKW